MYSNTKPRLFNPEELKSMLQAVNFKLAMHYNERPSHAINTGYVSYLESQIEQIKAKLGEQKVA